MPLINAAMQGLTAAERRLQRYTDHDRVSRALSAGGDGGDSVSLSDDAAGLIEARNAYQMNLQVLKVGDEMVKKIIDYLA